LRVLEELDNFLEFFLGFVGASDVFEGNLFLLRGKETRTATNNTTTTARISSATLR